MGLNQAHLPGETGRLIMGASGAISGVLGLFLVRCGFARVKVAHVTMALVQGQSRAGTSRINGFIAIGFWIFLQVVYGLISQRGGGVAYGSHLGGVVLGALFGVAMGLHRGAMTELVWTRSRRASEQGYWFAALGETLSYVKLAPNDIDGWLQLGRLYRILHRPAESVQAWQKAIDLLWRDRRRHEAVRAARELRHHYPLARIRPALLYRLGLHLERHGDLGWASHTFEDYARYYPGHQKAPEALIRAGDIEARLRDDLDRARKIYTEVVERYPDTREGQRARVELEMVSKIARNRCGEGEERERAAS
jgi:tetratricopeptide (TPR) repeat protein